MPKSEAVAILMQQNSNEMTVLFPLSLDINTIQNQSAQPIFASESIEFLNALSHELTKDPRVRAYSDVATFAFYCRKANILKIKDNYSTEQTLRLGRGIVFHIAPSNVPVNFAYSLLSGILAGNVNIVRVPSKEFEQVLIICNAIAKLAESGSFKAITERIYLIRYERQNAATALLSSICDVRVIWGGDATIEQIRKSPLPSRSFDVTFADRYSICAINADKYIDEQKPDSIALGFYNDTYLFDQNACTAPHLIIWTGENVNISKAKIIFWETLHKIINQKNYEVQAVIAVDKLTSLYTLAVQKDGVRQTKTDDNLIWRIELDSLETDIDEFRCSSGYFAEYSAKNLSELTPIINRKYQTLAYYGFSKDELADFILTNSPKGIDRIVPIGKTTDFSLNWDGYDLIKILSRCCEIKSLY